MEEKIKQLQVKLEADAGLGEKLFSQETAEEARTVMKEAGLDFSLEEVKQLRELIILALKKKPEGELSDADLEDVAGGVVGAALAAGAVLGAAGVVGVIGVGSAAVMIDYETRGRW